jgi:hypothetical protein
MQLVADATNSSYRRNEEVAIKILTLPASKKAMEVLSMLAEESAKSCSHLRPSS